MSLEYEDQSSPEKNGETLHSKIAYSRDFLLSLSELDVCKRLPSGFDQSILSEFEDASFGIQDRQRIPGSFPLQSSRRGDYSSSPPTKGDLSSYSRGVYGRWENRTSGRSDRDSDSQSDRDSVSSEPGRSYGNQSRKSWQRSEHDGLLGSGSFPKPSGYPPKVANDHYQLNKSNEPYHPPRPYKAVPHTRREAKDSLNDETFGSNEFTTEDRADEERRRRASFELMRKEQQKALQEKQKMNSHKLINETVSDGSILLDDTKDEKRPLDSNDVFNESVSIQVSNNDSEKSSFPSQTPASRPLVPPGFRSTILERNSGMKSSIRSNRTEIGKSEIGGSLSDAKAKSVQNETLNGQEEQLGMNDQLYRASSISESHGAVNSGEIIELDSREVTKQKIIGNSNQDHSTSILEKLFGGALPVNAGSSLGSVEVHDSKPDDTWSPNSEQSSKFAHWFLKEERKPGEGRKPGDELASSTRPNDLLSLIVGGEKAGSHISDVKGFQNLIPPDTSSAPIGTTDQLYIRNGQEAVPNVLTCEDLEQTFLSEFNKNLSTSKQNVQEWSVPGKNIEHPTANVDNRASQHLLSLLQNGTGPKEMTTPFKPDIEFSDKLRISEVENIENAKSIQSSSKTLFLETLFGTAFMKELKSVEAPVSVQRGSVGSSSIDVSESHGLPFRAMDDSLFPSSVDEIESNRIGIGSYVLAPNNAQKAKLDKIEDWVGYNDPQSEVDPPKLPSEVVPKLGGFDGTVQIQLPEEESLITAANPVNTPVDIAEKLSALDTLFKDERSMVGQAGPPFVHGPHGQIGTEIPFRNPHSQQSSTQFHASQMNHLRSFFPPLDAHPSDVNFMHRDAQANHQFPANILRPPMNHDGQTNHQFPPNLIRPPSHRPNAVLTKFDLPGNHPTFQQMQMAGSFPPHLLQEVPRGPPLPPQPRGEPIGFMHEMNPPQGFHIGHRQPNFGGLGMPMPAPKVNSGSNHPEAFQRLIEMEIRAKSKQIHPFGNVGHSQGGMYGNELDMGFHYR